MNAGVIVSNLLLGTFRSRFTLVFYRTTLLKNFAKVKKKHLSPSVTVMQPAALLKKTVWQECFPVSFKNAFKITCSQSTSAQLFVKSAGQLTLRNTQSLFSEYFNIEP